MKCLRLSLILTIMSSIHVSLNGVRVHAYIVRNSNLTSGREQHRITRTIEVRRGEQPDKQNVVSGIRCYTTTTYNT